MENREKIENIRKKLKERVNEKRYIHTLGVVEKAIEIGKKYGVDIQKLEIAGLLHDIAKNMNIDEMKKLCIENFSDEFDREDFEISELLHSFVGYLVAKDEFGIRDNEILEAIKYHTIGKKGLSILGRIIYIADGIEKNRVYPNVEYLREKVDENMDIGIIEEIDRKREYLEKAGGKLHKNTLEMREWLKSRVEEEK